METITTEKKKYTSYVYPETSKGEMRLQSIGLVPATEAANIKEGDLLMWNFGYKYEVVEILQQTEKSLKVATKSINKDDNGTIYTQRFLKSRLVCIVKVKE